MSEKSKKKKPAASKAAGKKKSVKPKSDVRKIYKTTDGYFTRSDDHAE